VSAKEKKQTGTRERIHQGEDVKSLILWNDDINSFDYVIECLVEVCEHNPMQAETCAWIAHYKGKCSVKKGTFEMLKPFYTQMSDRKLTVEIK